jgi:hypothetical protein
MARAKSSSFTTHSTGKNSPLGISDIVVFVC